MSCMLPLKVAIWPMSAFGTPGMACSPWTLSSHDAYIQALMLCDDRCQGWAVTPSYCMLGTNGVAELVGWLECLTHLACCIHG